MGNWLRTGKRNNKITYVVRKWQISTFEKDYCLKLNVLEFNFQNYEDCHSFVFEFGFSKSDISLKIKIDKNFIRRVTQYTHLFEL